MKSFKDLRESAKHQAVELEEGKKVLTTKKLVDTIKKVDTASGVNEIQDAIAALADFPNHTFKPDDPAKNKKMVAHSKSVSKKRDLAVKAYSAAIKELTVARAAVRAATTEIMNGPLFVQTESTDVEDLSEALSKYDIRYFNWPKVEFKGTANANDAYKQLLKGMKWKSYDDMVNQRGSTMRFNDYKIKEKESVAAFKKATGIDLNRLNESTDVEDLSEALSKYDIRYFNWPKVEFKGTANANDAYKQLLKGMKWKSYDDMVNQRGSTMRFNDYKIKEKESVAAFKKATGIDLNRL